MSYGTVVVCGGGCYGGYYVRQLARARAAGALQFERIIVVDRDPECRVALLIDTIQRDDRDAMATHGWRLHRNTDADDEASVENGYRGLPIVFNLALWTEFFEQWFAVAIRQRASASLSTDAVVPSPLMPNLLADWVATRLAVRHGAGSVRRVALSATPDTPWARDGGDGSHYASFATWMCPINCIEPPRCPETRGPRDWTMPAAVRDAAARAAERGTPYDAVALFRTTHRAYGVGMFDVEDALAADAAIQRALGETTRVLVASVSHCHGAMAELLAESATGTT